MTNYVLGIDIGTGSTKAVALDAAGGVVATAQQHYSSLPAPPGYAEQDPQTIWNAFVHCIQAVVEQLKQPPAIISLSSCMHSLIAVENLGKAVTPMINWADARSQAIAASLRQSTGAAQLYEATGTPLHSMSPLSKIIWFRQKEKETFLKAAKWISIKEYIWYKLFGVYEVDVSIAGATGLMDNKSFNWHAPALELAGITAKQLSTIQPTNFLRKNVTAAIADELLLTADTTFCIGSSDGCMANLGTAAMEKGVAALTIGTSGAVRVATASPVLDFEAMLFNYPIDEHTYICGGPVNNGGNMVHWALKKLLQQPNPAEKDYEAFYAQVGAVQPGSESLVCLPYFIGERAPVWDEQSSGVFMGVKAHHTPAHFCRAALEGVCFALADVLAEVEIATCPVTQLNVSGGFIRSQVWLQMLADITGKKLVITGNDDASAIGAALLALKAKKLFHPLPDTQQDVEVITPQPEVHNYYKQVFAIYKMLYAALKEPMHQLHKLQNVSKPF